MMTSQHLNSVRVLNVHTKLPDKLYIAAIMNAFIVRMVSNQLCKCTGSWGSLQAVEWQNGMVY